MSAFLNSENSCDIYMEQPRGFVLWEPQKENNFSCFWIVNSQFQDT